MNVRTNYFGDFENFALINGVLHPMAKQERYHKHVDAYGDTLCCIGNDFMQSDRDINPCIKMKFGAGSHVINLTIHHLRPYTGTTTFKLYDTTEKYRLQNTLLPGEIFNYSITHKQDVDFDMYFTLNNSVRTHSFVRVILETYECPTINGDSNTTQMVDKWYVVNHELVKLQNIKIKDYGNEYKY